MPHAGTDSSMTDWIHTDLSTTVFGGVNIDPDKCNGCTWCVQACPAKSLEIVDKKARMTATSECMFCGNCQAICLHDAVSLTQVPQWPGFFRIIGRGQPLKPRLNW